MNELRGRVAVLTGAASGFGLEVARLAAQAGMKVVMADVQADALARAADEIRGLGAEVLAQRCDVSKAEEVESLGAATLAAWGAPHFVFNNAGVALGGLVWEHSVADWNWVLGVNLWGVIHGVRVFTPMMLAAAQADPGYEGHIVNTASMAGVASAPNMGAYNVSKHGVVTLSETLYQDLALVTDQISASVLCPYFIPTGIHLSERNRPAELAAGQETKSQMISRVMSEKAITSAKVSAAEIAAKVLEAVRARQFYIFSHPHALAPVQSRLDDILQQRNPSDPFLARPDVGVKLRAALRGD